jgi:hypothetical protein
MWLLKDSPSFFPKISGRDEYTSYNNGRAALYSSQLERAEGYGEIWKIVKETVKTVLGKSRVSMMLFLDDLPLSIGAYHSVGTNNIVLNKALTEIAAETAKSRLEVNSFTYSLLTHEYLHALGYLSEDEVRHLVFRVSRTCFGEDHVATRLARTGPWALLSGVRIEGLAPPKSPIEVVKDFECPNKDYIV